MGELAFKVVGATATADAATPTIALALRIESREPVQAAALRCQIRIEPALRSYAANEAADLTRVLGPSSHPAAAAPLLWAHVALNLPAFVESTTADVLLPCPLDLRTGPATYLAALVDGDVPITLLFSGTIFHGARGEAIRVALVPWSAEARFALPVAVCREALRRHHGDATLVPLRRDALARLEAFRAEHGYAAVDDAIDDLLDRARTA